MQRSEKLNRVAIWVSSFFVLSVSTVLASPVLTVDTSTVGDSLIASLFNDGANTTFDVRGAVQFDVFNPGFVGAVYLVDSGGGTGGYSNPAFGNDFVIATNFGSQIGYVGFDFSNPIFLNGGTELVLTGTGVPLSPIPITDPALSQFIGPVSYTFDFLSATETNGGTLAVFGLANASIAATPEPATIALVMAGFAMLILPRVRRRFTA
jgi:hypothetical protein